MKIKTAAQEYLDAIREHVAVQKEETRMLKKYSPGTCNAEDAWHEFGDRQEKSAVNLRRLAKPRKAPLMRRVNKSLKNAEKLMKDLRRI
jgi:hypothetical protein